MILLVVDTQVGIMNDEIYKFELVKRNIQTLIDTARIHSTEVIYVQHDSRKGSRLSYGNSDFEIISEFKPQDKERVFVKTVNNSFHYTTGLLAYIKSKLIQDVMIVGLQTDFCIDATVKSGFDNDLNMIIPQFTNSTADNVYMSAETVYRFYNEFIWPGRYGKTVTMEEALEMLV